MPSLELIGADEYEGVTGGDDGMFGLGDEGWLTGLDVSSLALNPLAGTPELSGLGIDLTGLGADPVEQMLAGLGALNPRQKQALMIRNAQRKMLAQLHARGRHPGATGRQPITSMSGKVKADRLYPLPVNSSAVVTPGATATIVAQPQVAFKARHLQIADTILPGPIVLTASFWDIVDIRVGKNPQSPNPGALGGSSFQPTAVGSGFSFDTCPVGMLITVLATLNINAPAPAFFKATLWGDSLS